MGPSRAQPGPTGAKLGPNLAQPGPTWNAAWAVRRCKDGMFVFVCVYVCMCVCVCVKSHLGR